MNLAENLGLESKIADPFDNFDVDNDENFGKLTEGKYHLIITTRCDYSRFFSTIKSFIIFILCNIGIIIQMNINPNIITSLIFIIFSFDIFNFSMCFSFYFSLIIISYFKFIVT